MYTPRLQSLGQLHQANEETLGREAVQQSLRNRKAQLETRRRLPQREQLRGQETAHRRRKSWKPSPQGEIMEPMMVRKYTETNIKTAGHSL